MRSELLVALLLAPCVASADPLVGPSVGNADLLVSEASKLYNQKKHAAAAEMFLQATRADPSAVPPYLQLARSYLAAKQLRRACYAYRVYLKAAPDTPERKKAQSESDLCERQLRTAKKEPADPGPKYVEARAAFYAALEKKLLLGPGSASAAIGALVSEGFAGPELGELAQKLRAAAIEAANTLHQRTVAREEVAPEELASGRALFQLAADVGAEVEGQRAKSAFLDGAAELSRGDFAKAVTLLSEAASADPTPDYRYFHAMALYRSGDRKGALAAMEAHLPDDARTAVLRVLLALGQSGESGADELTRLLFTKRFQPPAK